MRKSVAASALALLIAAPVLVTPALSQGRDPQSSSAASGNAEENNKSTSNSAGGGGGSGR
ncbi:hypothetical protein U8607_02925 [Methylobacterium durans]|uniref:hypothetical protein n=1 Tax=Methylobacterium durans TaxID=2202825 RepID=UPI002AFE91B1|nr:hypothetical protein [Methylobacterium durans]MEA1831024.1 hypothetical protein [Methylobacterium durans]